MATEGRKRVIIEGVKPEIDGGEFPIKRVVGERVVVQADIFADGHDMITAALLYRKEGSSTWQESPMRPLTNDRWEGSFVVEETGLYYYTLQGWVDHIGTWQTDLKKKTDAGQDVRVDLLIGAAHLDKMARRASAKDAKTLKSWARILRKKTGTSNAISLVLSKEMETLLKKYPDKRLATVYDKELPVVVDRQKALLSAWYEMFPRSCGSTGHGNFKDCEKLLPEIAGMGFDVLYLPPIHPIGTTKRKGKNNVPTAEPDDTGSPWAIGSEEGGHKSIHPELGTMKDFERLISKANKHGIEVALDIAFQCSPDHPYVKEHPEWFRWRPDGTVQHAENPPKKYEDIIPLNFESDAWKELWDELKGVILFWIEKGIKIFRVDNPHTKSFAFWQWVIGEIKKDHPEVIFLSEAFTRPKLMYRLAKLGFTQSYTYFTWRNTKWELMEYVRDLTQTDVREYFRPNFWPNTPDILPEYLQYGGRPSFIIRLILAATLSSNYGIYGPAFELCVADAMPEKEEYLYSEKYEVKHWDWNKPESLRDLITSVNRIRKENPAFHTTWNLRFYETDNEKILFYGKATDDLSNVLLIAVNLDPYNTQTGKIRVPIEELGITPKMPYLVHDLISDDKYVWYGDWNYVVLNPHVMPAHILRVHRKLRREADFDYFM